MSKFSCYMPDDLIADLNRLGQSDKVGCAMVDAAAPILEKNVKSECSKRKRTGNMYNSVKKTKAKRASNGAYIAVVRPTGTSRTYIDNRGKEHKRVVPVRNMEIMAYMEYGTSRQAPTPVLSKAVNDSSKPVYAAMQEEFNKQMSSSLK